MSGTRAIITLITLANVLACAPEVIEAPGTDEVGESAGTTDAESTSAAESMGSESTTASESSSESESTTADTTTTDTVDTTDTTTTDTTTTETTDAPPDCVDNLDCDPGNCLEGGCVVVSSCKQLAELDTNDALGDGVYQLDPDADGPSPAYSAYCDMTTMGGGWTLVLKSNGNLDTFKYGSAEWGSPDPFQPQFPDLDRNEAKLVSYARVAVDELMIGIEAPIGVDPAPLALSWIVVPVSGASLHALISPGVLVPTAVGRNTWKSLMAGSSLQLNCNQEGLNAMPSQDLTHHRVRIGIVGNEQNDCNSPNSRIGIGGDGNKCMTLPNATGNFAGCQGDNGDANQVGFGVVLVR